jgi:hypothetical protein
MGLLTGASRTGENALRSFRERLSVRQIQIFDVALQVWHPPAGGQANLLG